MLDKYATSVFRFACFLLILLFTSILFSFGEKKDPLIARESIVTEAENELIANAHQAMQADDDQRFHEILYEKIQKAELTYRNEDIAEACITYLNHLYQGFAHPEIINIVERLSELSPSLENSQMKFRSWIAIAKGYNFLDNYDESYQYAAKALSQASAGNMLKQKIEANLELGTSLLGQDNIVEAYQSYLNAQYLIMQLKDNEKYLKRLRHQLYLFHFQIGNYEEANQQKIIQLRACETQHPLDSLELMWLKYDLAFIKVNMNLEYLTVSSLEEILDFAERNHYKRLKNYTHALIRKYLVEQNDLSAFYHFYNNRAPEELERIRDYNLNQYYVFKAYFKEHQNQVDSAIYYFDRAEETLHLNDNPYYKANFYRRMGEFYDRLGNQSLAQEAFKQSYELSRDLDFPSNILSVSKNLEGISIASNDFEKAHEYQAIYNQNYLNKLQESHGELLLKMEIENQAKEAEYMQQQKEEEIRKKHSAQFFGIAIGVIILMIIVAIISSMQVPAWFIEMLVFFSIVSLFELIILYMDHEFHKLTHGEPIKMFMIKVVIISFLYPLHHVVEHALTRYLKKNNLIKKPSPRGLRQSMAALWPWLLRNGNKDKH